MALQLDFKIPAGMNTALLENDESISTLIRTVPVVVTNGYVKIGHYSGNESEARIEVEYKESREKEPILSLTLKFVPDFGDEALNIVKQGYKYLKTLPEFESAIDVLEEGQVA